MPSMFQLFHDTVSGLPSPFVLELDATTGSLDFILIPSNVRPERSQESSRCSLFLADMSG